MGKLNFEIELDAEKATLEEIFVDYEYYTKSLTSFPE